MVLHSTGSYLEQIRSQLVEIIEVGLKIVSTCEELAYPQAQHPAQARWLIAAFEEALAAGQGAIEVDGKMVDLPVVRGARALLENYEVIRERERRVKEAS